eukprot:sb/3464811/
MVTATGPWCMISSYIRPFIQPISFVTVVLISALRVYSLYFPLSYRNQISKRRVILTTYVVWFLTILGTIPTTWFVKGYNYNLIAKQCFWNFTEESHIKFGFVYNLVVFLLLFALLAFMTILLTLGLYERHKVGLRMSKKGPQNAVSNNHARVAAKGSGKSTGSGGDGGKAGGRGEKQKTDYKHASLISIAIGVVFMISILPFYIYGMIRFYSNVTNKLDKNTQMLLRMIAFWMLYLSPTLNPLLYVLRLPNVRNELVDRSNIGLKSIRNQTTRSMRRISRSVMGPPPPNTINPDVDQGSSTVVTVAEEISLLRQKGDSGNQDQLGQYSCFLVFSDSQKKMRYPRKNLGVNKNVHFGHVLHFCELTYERNRVQRVKIGGLQPDFAFHQIVSQKVKIRGRQWKSRLSNRSKAGTFMKSLREGNTFLLNKLVRFNLRTR